MAIALGMAPKDFWEADVTLFWAYVRAGKIKREQEDRLAWAQGYYNNLAFADVLSAAFTGKGKKHEPIYPKKPIFSGDPNAKKKADKKKQTAQDRAAAVILERLTLLNERTNLPFNDQ